MGLGVERLTAQRLRCDEIADERGIRIDGGGQRLDLVLDGLLLRRLRLFGGLSLFRRLLGLDGLRLFLLLRFRLRSLFRRLRLFGGLRGLLLLLHRRLRDLGSGLRGLLLRWRSVEVTEKIVQIVLRDSARCKDKRNTGGAQSGKRIFGSHRGCSLKVSK